MKSDSRQRFYQALALAGATWNTAIIIRYSRIGGDFDHEYQAALALLQGIPVYSLNNNPHPPFAVLYGIPFTAFDAQSAFVAHGILSYMIFVALVLVSCRLFEIPARTCWAVLGIGSFLYPLRSSLALGTLSLHVALLLALCWKDLMLKKENLAGILLALAALLKIYPIILVPFLLVTGRFRAFWVCVTAILVSTASLVPIFGFEQLQHFAFRSSSDNYSRFKDFPDNLSIWGVIEKLCGSREGYLEPLLLELGWSSNLLSSVIAATIFVLSLWAAAIARKSKDEASGYALGLVTMLIISPLSWGHYLIALLPVLLIVFFKEQQRAKIWRAVLILSALEVMHLITYFTGHVSSGALGAVRLLIPPALLLWVWLECIYGAVGSRFGQPLEPI